MGYKQLGDRNKHDNIHKSKAKKTKQSYKRTLSSIEIIVEEVIIPKLRYLSNRRQMLCNQCCSL